MPPPSPHRSSPRWRLASLTLAVLALHGLAFQWWLTDAPAPRPASPTGVMTLASTPTPVAAPMPAPQRPLLSPAATVSPPPSRSEAQPKPTTQTAPMQPPVLAKSHTAPHPVVAGGNPATPREPALSPPPSPQHLVTPPLTQAPEVAPYPPATAPETESSEQNPASALMEKALTATISTAQAAPSTPESTGPTPATTARHLVVPPSMELSYQVQASSKGLTLPAQSTLSWQTDGHSYSARLDIKAALGRTRSQTSMGRIDPALGLQPQRFGDKNRSEQATHFDRTRTPPVIRFSSNAPDVPLQPHSQDRLSVLIQLAAMLAGEPERHTRGHSVVVHTAGSRDADLWRFTVGTTDTLDLPMGPLPAVHLRREPLHTYDNRVEVWLAPSLGYLPVRILWTQANGDVVDQRLSGHRP